MKSRIRPEKTLNDCGYACVRAVASSVPAPIKRNRDVQLPIRGWLSNLHFCIHFPDKFSSLLQMSISSSMCPSVQCLLVKLPGLLVHWRWHIEQGKKMAQLGESNASHSSCRDDASVDVMAGVGKSCLLGCHGLAQDSTTMTALGGDGQLDVSVSFDGSWHRRGRCSHTGIATVIEVFSGLILDFITLSNYCLACELGQK